MDITIEEQKKFNWRYVKIALGAVMIIACAWWLKGYFGQATALVDSTDVRTAKVQTGQFQVSVRGMGVLKPKEVIWVASEVAGRVEKVFVKAGAVVEKGQPIVKLNNPKLSLVLANAQAKLEKTIAENTAQYAQFESDLLDAEAAVKRAKMTHQGNELELNAQRKLREMGNSSVSQIKFKRTEFTVQSSKLDHELQQQRLEKLKLNIEAQKQAHKAQQQTLQQELARAQEQLDNLYVRAAMDGVLQSMDLELGQDVAEGGSVGKIANPRSLIAEIDVQELQIKDVAPGLAVTIDTRKSQIQGVVSRVSPQVEKGLVAVEVDLVGTLPSEARPELSIEGVINITDKPNTLFVAKPAFAEEYQSTKLFKVDRKGNIAQAVQVKFGQSSVNYIEITEGLSNGDTVIISATDNFANNEKIFLHN
ncbi:efflux RND transporter periplasmic adaptor subunit [Pseudoalteromonas rubra]|uniref:RND transporter n=1 Tax=Pseudoalteromonas rubra TaxID=43658 RepID=A0A4Q7DYM1_9GAMM|nr:HlyD family efflux transporter periplasmic adaptor subunit [Pseudoalteromonas rubra]RZM71494.1 RND transporter [Pseudoalteromonas rubra]